MRQGRLVATGVMLAFCLFAAWQSWLLPLTDRLGPGPGFFPFWMALIGIALAIGLLVVTVATPATAPAEAPDGDGEICFELGQGTREVLPPRFHIGVAVTR